MDGSVRQFVERMALACEKDGMARSAGRIFALLLVSDRPCSLDELAGAIQASRASVSTNARLLESLGMIERVTAPGDRRDFYQIGNDPWERMVHGLQGRWRGMVEVFQEACEGLPPGCGRGRARLEQAERFHVLLLEQSETLLRQWRRSREGGGE